MTARPLSRFLVVAGSVALMVPVAATVGARIDDASHQAYVDDTRSPVATTAEPTTSATAPKPNTATTPRSAPTTVTEKDASPIKSASPGTTGESHSPDIWHRLADCESGEWDRNGNVVAGTARWDDQRDGYEGGLHFVHDTWVRAGGRRYAEHAYDATPAQQIEIADAWLARTSWRQWPVCSRKVGAR